MLKARPAIIAVVGGQSFGVFELFLVSVPRLESWESESHVHIGGKERREENGKGKKKKGEETMEKTETTILETFSFSIHCR